MNWKRAAIILGIVAGAWLILRRGDLERPTAKLEEAELVQVISHGESVDLTDHVGKQGWTVVEFTASSPGRHEFACGMGMLRGSILVK